MTKRLDVAVALGTLLAATAGRKASVAKKVEEARQHFLELDGDDAACREAVEKSFERRWNHMMSQAGGDKEHVKAIVSCLNGAAGQDCCSAPD